MNIVLLTQLHWLFFNMWNAFDVNIVVVYAVWHIFGSIFNEKCVQNLKKKVNKIGLKGLY